MNEKIALIVMGERNSGKSSSWNELFGRTVRTGKHLKELRLTQTESVDVFLVSGSPEERGEYVGDLIVDNEPRIVLCSMQYSRNSLTTIDYFIKNGYSLYVQWINPGNCDQSEAISHDRFGLIPYLHENGAITSIRNGKIPIESRVQELKEYIYGWSNYRSLITGVRFN